MLITESTQRILDALNAQGYYRYNKQTGQTDSLGLDFLKDFGIADLYHSTIITVGDYLIIGNGDGVFEINMSTLTCEKITQILSSRKPSCLTATVSWIAYVADDICYLYNRKSKEQLALEVNGYHKNAAVKHLALAGDTLFLALDCDKAVEGKCCYDLCKCTLPKSGVEYIIDIPIESSTVAAMKSNGDNLYIFNGDNKIICVDMNSMRIEISVSCAMKNFTVYKDKWLYVMACNDSLYSFNTSNGSLTQLADGCDGFCCLGNWMFLQNEELLYTRKVYIDSPMEIKQLP